MTEKADVAVIGTGVMGRSLARNFARHGHTVALFDVAPGRAAQVAQEHSAEGNFIPTQDPVKLAESMSTPRVAILLCLRVNRLTRLSICSGKFSPPGTSS